MEKGGVNEEEKEKVEEGGVLRKAECLRLMFMSAAALVLSLCLAHVYLSCFLFVCSPAPAQFVSRACFEPPSTRRSRQRSSL